MVPRSTEAVVTQLDSARGATELPLQRPWVRTSLPGPGSRELLARQAQHESNARSYPRKLPIAIRRGAGSYVEDVDGNVFIDFLTGAGAVALGHSHPEVVEAVGQQLPLLSHALDLPTEIKDEFVSAQLAKLPEQMRERTKIQFCGPAGADAVDAALKLCKTATGRSDVVSFQGSFHGSTHSTMAISGMLAQRERVRNTMPGVHFFPYPYGLRCALPGDPETVGSRCAEYLERTLKDPLGGIPRPAAVILEVVQGEGGVIPAPTDFMQRVRRVTRELEIPLIVDEVQSGCGRSGTWFAFEQHGIVPDVIVASKAIGGIGMPLAVILYDASLDVWSGGAHTGTFRGNQLAFAASVAACRIIDRDGIIDSARRLGAYARARLDEIVREREIAIEARNSGLMLGIEVADPATGEPASELARAVHAGALRRGLILELGGRDDAVVRMLPPINVSRTTLDQALEILGAAFEGAELAAESERPPKVQAEPVR
jgi:diaminobutyrate-2-oxoglutarate transaminase